MNSYIAYSREGDWLAASPGVMVLDQKQSDNRITVDFVTYVPRWEDKLIVEGIPVENDNGQWNANPKVIQTNERQFGSYAALDRGAGRHRRRSILSSALGCPVLDPGIPGENSAGLRGQAEDKLENENIKRTLFVRARVVFFHE